MASTSSITSEDGTAQLNSTKDLSTGSSEVRVEKAGEGKIQESKKQQQSDWRAAAWEWPCYEELYNKQGQVTGRKKKVKEDGKKDPFEVIYCQKKGLPWPEHVLVEIHSEQLQMQLQKIWPKKQKLRLKTFPIKGKDLYLKLGQLKQCLDPNFEEGAFKEAETDETIGQMQLRHLIRFVETEYSKTIEMHQHMKESGRVSFDMLWTFMTRGENLVYRCGISDEELCGKIRKTVYKLNTGKPPQWCLELTLDVFNYNCEGYKKYSRKTEVLIYEDEKHWRELEAYPYRFLDDSAEIEAGFLARGARFGYLACSAKYRYMQFSGSMFTSSRNFGRMQILKEGAHGRAMLDQFSFSKMNNDRVMDTSEPSSKVAREARVRTVDISQDPNRIYAPAIVYGFSFHVKKWGCFSVEGFSEVVFDGGSSWDQLVMDPNLKEVTEHLVAQHLRNSEDGEQGSIDPIPNKGGGCVIICYGPPGTGKTLTAESLAEKLHAPLWSLSVSDLGVTSHDLDTKLVHILDIAASWKTVLLLDEADIYLEKRTTSNLLRNAMCGIFLKNLEYYRGVLLLTTNRIPTFDDAFRSRISVFLRYPPLMVQQREKIWTNLLSRAQIKEDGGAVQQLVKDMAVFELNGREIRNAIQNAQALAQAIKEPLGCKHILSATEVLACALNSLKDSGD
ncbi:hypothetical protein R1sor_008294 [Riccia sorocarpa]|uniref:AAA+ ATPase domain-containing protein n=1 Tax=Riccia sorocarpa TaxID=122646 RepID=A0ABD3HTD0_9MARC